MQTLSYMKRYLCKRHLHYVDKCMRVRVCYNMYTYLFIGQAWTIFLELQVSVTFFFGHPDP